MEYSQLSLSLINIIGKALSGLKVLTLYIDNLLPNANLDSCLNYIFNLDLLNDLRLTWNRLSVGKIISALNKQERKKQISILHLSGIIDLSLS